MRFADVLSWRWTPTFALVGGSLVFVLVAIAVVPDQVGDGLDERAQRTSASAGPFSRLGASSSAGMPFGAAPPAVSAHGHTRERRRARERRQHTQPSPADGSSTVTHETRAQFGNMPVDRLFNRTSGLPVPPEAAPLSEPPAADQAEAPPVEAPPAEAPAEAPAPAPP